ncbi:MAG: Gfo/Idh/MocA family oxidoreductase [Gemmatimonadetes bacterium]|nr:Gfo/Idh/MocA family oxidoreductase [Gemmatimonadota bacterium]MCY3942376.1 Gfo/Idh/MocA family oxidoreductase [Gemmatimonadota bacterium]
MTGKGGKVRIGVFGTGAISQLMHLPMLSERPDVELAAVCDPDELKARSVAERFGIPQVLADEAMVAARDIDGVVVAAPSFLHEVIAAQCLERGKDVLVERPLALSPGGARWLVDAAQDAGRSLVLGMAHRYQSDVMALRRAVADGALGTIGAVRVTWLNCAKRRPRSGWRRRALESGGGVLIDIGVPALDLALWVLGYPGVERVSALTLGDEVDDVEEDLHLHACAEGGVAISLSASWRFHGPDDQHRIEVFGSRGTAVMAPLSIHRDEGGRTVDATPRLPQPSGGESMFTSGYRRLLDRFVAIVAGRAEAEPPTEQVALMRLVEAAYRSAQEGREVTVSA